MNHNTEIWKDVLEYEGLYQISNLGRVRSRYKTARTKDQSDYLLSPNKDRRGYLNVLLYKNGVGKRKWIARLVALAFLPKTKETNIVNHKNFNILDNTPENLEWCTQQYNVLHAHKNGRMGDPKEYMKRAAITRKIRRDRFVYPETTVVIDLNNGIFHSAVADAARSANIPTGTLRWRLKYDKDPRFKILSN